MEEPRPLCSPPMTRAAIKHAEDSLRTAMLSSDVDALDRLLHDDLVFVGPTGALATKAHDLANYRSGAQVITSHRPRDLQIVLFGDDTAVSTVVVELEGSVHTRRFSGTYRYIRTWRRGPEGSWRVIAGAVAAEAAA